jgi:hypothetical protein
MRRNVQCDRPNIVRALLTPRCLTALPLTLIRNHYNYITVLSTYPFLLCFLTLSPSSLFHFSIQLSVCVMSSWMGETLCVCVCVCVHSSTALVSLGFRTVDVSRSHSIRHKTLWMSDRPFAESSAWQHTTLIRERYPCPRRDSNPKSQQASDRMPTS